MFDGLMRKVGLNGRSIVALVSSGACAIPAIMSARTIGNWKERMITILVSPLISCSARIPVYVILVGFVVAPGKVYGFERQGLVFMALYLLGIVFALLMGFVFKYLLKSDEPSQLMIELPRYKPPRSSTVWVTVRDKVKAFVVEAGKVIFVISIVLWFLASYGPGDSMNKASSNAQEITQSQSLDEGEAANLEASLRLEASYAGRLGKLIEPAIAPLGFDWKIGIALISSFAAREVFVGTMATIYSVGSADDEATLRERMRAEMRPSGDPRFNLATSLSLLIFYVFAMQCMSTLAVTYKETRSWKWPGIQLAYMTALAYFGSLLVYQVLS
jgi:ferrous iron transport protein B